ncbi:ABC transporter permease [Robertmurraya yapensis]|uniref:Glutathione transport system permease protein GsiD n=1 Tax=Bacillus yapensis TaxID=2492960 RepID=A0A3S0K440_9BACI|nr:ABC transporter permease [Bacillus yapensis]RTR35189.1 ABC transporter permease [Bacillus yapensis]TKS97698.1 ABC transporter permease subunit [Bacillus yapensis]
MAKSEIYKPIQARVTSKSPMKLRADFLKRIFKDKRAVVCILFLFIVSIVGIFAPIIAPFDPEELFYDSILEAPNKEHLLGTDAIGRDLLSRLIYGVRVTLTVSLLAVAITFFLGTFIGLVCAYVGGWVDNVLMRIMDILLALPSIILALAIVAILGPSLTNAMIAVGVASIPGFARLIRGAALTIKSSMFVEASRSIGSSHSWILRRQFLPNVTGILLVYTTLFIGVAILDTAALSFIGLGAQPPTPEWGTMLSEGRNYMQNAWWLATFPGIAITMVVFAVNFLGDALRDIFDPKSSG